MPKRSEFTDAVMEVAEELKAMHRAAAKVRAIPFGMERVGIEAARTRIESMTPEERRQVVRQIGIDKALELMRRKGDAIGD